METPQVVTGYKIDPDTHPIMLYEFEHDEFIGVLALRGRPHSPHLHDWVYRLGRPAEEFYVIRPDKVNGGDILAYTSLAPGRYCRHCHKVEFVDEAKAKKHTNDRWTQKDMIALGIK